MPPAAAAAPPTPAVLANGLSGDSTARLNALNALATAQFTEVRTLCHVPKHLLAWAVCAAPHTTCPPS
jgi:hypothetical protein